MFISSSILTEIAILLCSSVFPFSVTCNVFEAANNLLLINKEIPIAGVYIGVSHRLQSLLGLLCAFQCKLDYSPFGELGLILALLCRMQLRI